MLSIKEIVDKTVDQRKQIKNVLDSRGQFHPDIKTPEQTRCTILDGLSGADQQAIRESIDNIPLREFLAKSGTTGIAGAAYLVPDKLHSDLIFYSRQTDLVPLIGRVVTGWTGGPLKVDVVSDTSYAARRFTGGGKKASDTPETMQATITPVGYSVLLPITNDLIEDSAYDMIDFHVQNGAKALGEKSSELALTDLKTATDGWGTKNSSATGDADETSWTGGTTADIDDALADLTDDRWIANTIIMTTEAWQHSVQTTFGAETAGGAAGDYWVMRPYVQAITTKPVADGFDLKMLTLDVLFSDNVALYNGEPAGTAMTNCVTIVYDRMNGLLTGRKRWLQINKYSDPTQDMSAAVISFRQDSVTLYDDAIYVLTET